MACRLPHAVAAALALVVLAAGCSLLIQGRTVATLPGGEGFHEVPVGLDDPDGLVATVELAPPDPSFVEAAVTKVDPQSVLLTWLGGACDARAVIKVTGNRETIWIVTRTDQSVGFGCTAVGIPRAVTITFRDPLGDRSIVLNPGR